MINIRQAALYLSSEHDTVVTTATIINWIKNGRLEGAKGTRWSTSKVAIDAAMVDRRIPPKAGRRRKYTKEQRAQMCAMRSNHTLKEIALHFGCDESLISRICRGLR